MKDRVNSIIDKFRIMMASKVIFKKILFVSICILFFAYSFSFMAFSDRVGYNLIPYPIVILLAACSFFYLLSFDKFVLDQRSLFYLCFFFIALISTIIGTRKFEIIKSLFFMIATFFVIFYTFQVIKKEKIMFNLLIGATLCFALYYTIIYRTQIFHLNFSDRLGRYFGNENDVGLNLCFGAMLSYVLAINGKKWLYFIPALVLSLLSISTGSKKVYIALLLILIICLFVRFKRNKIALLIVFGALLVIVVVLINLPFMSSMKERFLDMFATLLGGGGSDVSTIQRFQFVDGAINIGMKNILIGVGQDGYSIYGGYSYYSHCNLSEIFCNFGLASLFIFYLPFIFLFLSINRIESQTSRSFCYIFVIVHTIFSLAMVFYYGKSFYVFLALCFYLSQDSSFKITKRWFDEYLGTSGRLTDLADQYYEVGI